jgi:aerobic-type carbon monoxide dehydrogenase small subunit (CoxS/CutS family)
MRQSVRFTLNGSAVTVDADDERPLLSVLRTELALTGTKFACGVGLCGACTVLVGGRALRSCRTALKAVAGHEVVTVEGLAAHGVLHPLQQAFLDHGAYQCGFCTPGMLMTAAAFLQATPHPSHEAIVAHMDHNLCRCGAHQRIVAAIEAAATALSPARAPAEPAVTP